MRFLVLHQQPADVAALEKHYFEMPVPLAKRLPGLRRYAVSLFSGYRDYFRRQAT